MSSWLGLVVFGLGIILLIIALDALGTSRAEVLRLGGISPPDGIWLLGGGVMAVISGLALAFRGRKQ